MNILQKSKYQVLNIIIRLFGVSFAAISLSALVMIMSGKIRTFESMTTYALDTSMKLLTEFTSSCIDLACVFERYDTIFRSSPSVSYFALSPLSISSKEFIIISTDDWKVNVLIWSLSFTIICSLVEFGCFCREFALTTKKHGLTHV